MVAEWRIWLALLLALSWLLWTVGVLRRSSRAQSANRPTDGSGQLLVAFASQTGFAEEWARHSAQALRAGGLQVVVQTLARLTLTGLRSDQPRRVLFVVSTCGEGDPPDNAAAFARQLMSQGAQLPMLQYAVLALGDRSYQQFCGFGRALHAWLQTTGAQPLAGHGLIEVDNADPVAHDRWQALLHSLGAPDTAAAAGWSELTEWRITERECLNAGSPGAPAFLLKLCTDLTGPISWRAGDLAEVHIAGEPGPLKRHYSIASCPHDGALWLLVRQHRDSQGLLGAGSGLLTQHKAIGETIQLRVQRNPAFQLPDDDRALILIGNGTGIAGLRALLSERVRRGHRANWLLFGERSAAHDRFFGEEIRTWQQSGLLQRVDLSFSRDGGRLVYVQDLLAEAAISQSLHEWLAAGAAIYVCGSQHGMAPAVHGQLQRICGESQLQELLESGRYRRDVY